MKTKRQRLGLLARIALLETLGRKPCWPWPWGKYKNGYGMTTLPGSQVPMGAHLAIYLTLIGPVPDGLELDHTCNNRVCCNPWHMEPVTHAENCRRAKARRLICKNGHPFTPENSYIDEKYGQRHCRRCRYLATEASNERRRQRKIASGEQRDPSFCRHGHDKRVVGVFTPKHGRGPECAECRRLSAVRRQEKRQQEGHPRPQQ